MQTTDVAILPPDVVRAARARRTRLAAALTAASVDAMLVDFPIDIRYLTGFIGDDSLLLVDGDGATILSDPRYDEYLEPWRAVVGLDVVMGVRHRLERSVGEGLRAGTRLGVQADHLTIARREALAAALPGVELVPVYGVVARLRMCKDEVEIAAIERAVAIQEAALEAALDTIAPGTTELGLAGRLEYEMKTRGAERSSFDPIVASGPSSSVIHYSTSATPLGPGVLLIDWGALAGGYCSDMTRTFCLGPVPAKVREIYEIVLEAHCAAIDACAPGRTCAEIDAVAREIITRAGYGEQFGHGLGHGLGMQVHETPYFNDLETETRLEPGMVMTVEPGIYVPGVGGVRIEDDVLITDTGARSLCNRAKDVDSMVIETRL